MSQCWFNLQNQKVIQYEMPAWILHRCWTNTVISVLSVLILRNMLCITRFLYQQSCSYPSTHYQLGKACSVYSMGVLLRSLSNEMFPIPMLCILSSADINLSPEWEVLSHISCKHCICLHTVLFLDPKAGVARGRAHSRLFY